jgi:uncharacterized protein (DUF2225 family)
MHASFSLDFLLSFSGLTQESPRKRYLRSRNRKFHTSLYRRDTRIKCEYDIVFNTPVILGLDPRIPSKVVAPLT